MKGTIKSRRGFQRIYNEGRRAVGPHMVVFAFNGSEFPQARASERVGIVASRKVGNAVARSRAKRVMRAAYREIRARLPEDCRLILVARRAIITDATRSTELQRELEKLLVRAGCVTGVES